MPNIGTLARKIGYRFSDESLLRTAFMHTSYVNEHPDEKLVSNQRLEFLGDAVVELVVTNELYARMGEADEGRLSSLRSRLVCTDALAYAAGELGLSEYLMMGVGADKTGERENPTVLEDAFEALAGAVYLDGGYRKAAKFIMKALMVQILNMTEGCNAVRDSNDNKTALQIRLQKNGPANICYALTKEDGPPHSRVFFIDVKLNGRIIGSGKGRSKKDAEQDAAKHALREMKKR
jgi:ribonuclease-3